MFFAVVSPLHPGRWRAYDEVSKAIENAPVIAPGFSF